MKPPAGLLTNRKSRTHLKDSGKYIEKIKARIVILHFVQNDKGEWVRHYACLVF